MPKVVVRAYADALFFVPLNKDRSEDIGARCLEDMIQCVQHIQNNPLAGQKDACALSKSQVYFYQYGLASVLYTLECTKGAEIIS